MKKPKGFYHPIFLSAILLLLSCPIQSQTTRFAFTCPSMGSQTNIVFYAQDSVQANLSFQKVKYLLDSLELILSDYNPASEINRLDNKNTTASQSISPVLHELLLLSKEGYAKSGGVFDCTIGTLTKLWRAAKKNKVLPSKKQIKMVLATTGFDKVYIARDSLSIRYRVPGIQLDFGGIAKGYAAQKAIEMLQKNGIQSALVDMGGDIATGAPPPGSEGWSISINRPESATSLIETPVLLSDKAIATSGKLYNYFEVNHKKYSHIIDPATGKPLLHNRQITVIADDGATADWLATACSVLPVRKSLRLIRQVPEAGILILENKNEKIRAWYHGAYFE
jgi:thiamine biosynthesis lipoprotein